jgi:hypothetical protein
MAIAKLRDNYHRNLCKKILFIRKGIPNFADGSSKTSVAVALKIIARLNYPLAKQAPPGQTAGVLFEQITKDFLRDSFKLLNHLRPGKWLTTAYHLGYSDFRSKKIIQPNIGNTIISMPTLVSANPVGSPVVHAIMHITAIIHSPKTELFLPPHRE